MRLLITVIVWALSLGVWGAETSVVPSFTADGTEGFQNSGFVVQFTNVSLALPIWTEMDR